MNCQRLETSEITSYGLVVFYLFFQYSKKPLTLEKLFFFAKKFEIYVGIYDFQPAE